MGRSQRFEQVAFAAGLRDGGASWSEVAAALRERYRLGARAAARLAHGWTQQDAADRWTARWPESPISGKTVSWWECWPASGHAPSLATLVRLAELYEVAVADLVADLGDFGEDETGPYISSVERRAFLRALAGTVASAGLPSVEGRGRRVGAADVERLRVEVRALGDLDDRHGGQVVFDRAVESVRGVREVLDTASYGPTVGRDLQVVAGELTEMAAWTAFDAGEQGTARRLWTEALTYAQLTESAPLTVAVLASMALQASRCGSGREAVELAQAAQRCAHGFASARLLSLLAAREALGHARAGDTPACHGALVRSERLLTDGDEPGEEWVQFWGPADQCCAVAAAHLVLGAPHAAGVASREAIRETPPTYPRNRALYGGMLAEALVRQGHIDEGAHVASEALSGVRSGRLRHQIAALRPQLQPHASTSPAVAGCLAQLDAGR